MRKLTEINQVTLKYVRPHISELPEIKDSSKAIDILRSTLDEGILDLKERSWILLLTSNNHLLGVSEIGTGGIDQVKIFYREIIQSALLSNAQCFILVHNHPNGSLKFSENDINGTKEIKKIAAFMGIHMRDHLVITSEDYNSIRNIMTEW